MKRLLLILIFLLISGCIGFHDTAINKGIQSRNIYIGASKYEVESAIKKPLNICIKTKTTANGYYEMWDYASDLCGVNFSQNYILIFKDDILTEIRTVRTIYDMQF